MEQCVWKFTTAHHNLYMNLALEQLLVEARSFLKTSFFREALPSTKDLWFSISMTPFGNNKKVESVEAWIGLSQRFYFDFFVCQISLTSINPYLSECYWLLALINDCHPLARYVCTEVGEVQSFVQWKFSPNASQIDSGATYPKLRVVDLYLQNVCESEILSSLQIQLNALFPVQVLVLVDF